jgi:hypothetical protein
MDRATTNNTPKGNGMKRNNLPKWQKEISPMFFSHLKEAGTSTLASVKRNLIDQADRRYKESTAPHAKACSDCLIIGRQLFDAGVFKSQKEIDWAHNEMLRTAKSDPDYSERVTRYGLWVMSL